MTKLSLSSRDGNGSGAKRTRISAFSCGFRVDPDIIFLEEADPNLSLPPNNLVTKSALHSAETLGIHLKFGRKNAPIFSEVLNFVFLFCFGLHLNLKKMYNQSIVVIVDWSGSYQSIHKVH